MGRGAYRVFVERPEGVYLKDLILGGWIMLNWDGETCN
jgi:hypothetical protein